MPRLSDQEHIRSTRNVSRFFVENRSISWVLLVATVAWGIYGYVTMPKSKDPDVPVRIALVSCPWPGVSAEKVEQLVTRPIENKIAESDFLHKPQSGSRYGIQSLSLPGMALIRVQLDERVMDVVEPFNQINLDLNALNDSLPSGAGPIHFDSQAGETAALMLTVASPRASDVQVRIRADGIEKAIRAERSGLPASERRNRAAFVLVFPHEVNSRLAVRMSEAVADRIQGAGLMEEIVQISGSGFVGFDGVTQASDDAALKEQVREIARLRLGANQIHPDAWEPILVRDPSGTYNELIKSAGPRYSYAQLDDATALISRSLQSVAQVSRVTSVGNLPQQVWLSYSQEQLAAYGLKPSKLKDALSARNITTGAGVVESGDVQLFLEPTGAFNDPSEIGDVAISFSSDGSPVYLRDLVEISSGYESPPRFLNFYGHRGENGNWRRSPAITLAVDMRHGEQVGVFGEEVNAALDELRGRLPDDLILAQTSDEPRQVEESIDLFMTALYEAIILVVIVAWIGFREWRSALLMSISIPLTLAMTFGAISVIGIELQQVSIATLIIALGLLVDDPVVAGDAIKRSMAQGQPPEVASWLGPTKLAGAILFATITNIVAYLPFLLLTGNTGSFLWSLPVVMATTLISSRVVSMTFIPLLGYYLLRPEKAHLSLEDRKKSGLSGRYYRVAGESFDRRGRVFALSLLVLILGFGVGSRLPSSFFPEEVEYLSYIDLYMPTSSPVAHTDAVARKIEDIVRRVADEYVKKQGGEEDSDGVLKSVTSFVGGGGPRFWSTFTPQLMQNNYAELLLEVYDKDFTPELIGPLQAAMDAEVPGAIVQVRQLQTNPVAYPVSIEISGRSSLSAESESRDIRTLHLLSEKVKAILRSAPGVGNVYDDWMSEGFEVTLDVDPDRANEAGVTNADVAQSVAAAVSGAKVGTLLKGDDQIPIVARLTLDERGNLSDLEGLYVYSSQNSNKVPLKEVATLEYSLSEQRIWRRDHFRTISAVAYPQEGVLASSVLGSVLEEIEALQASLPPGVRMEIAGERAQQQDGFQQLSLIMLISVIGIFVALVVQFGSTVKPILVFAAVPYGIAGALLALAVTDTPFGFMAFLGISSLVGVIVSHVIVLFDFVEETQEAGEPLREGLLDAGLERLRPVMITVGATVLALVPLAIHGGPLWQPLCFAQIGGLSLATFIELLLVPVLYAIFVLDLKFVKWNGAAEQGGDGIQG